MSHVKRRNGRTRIAAISERPFGLFESEIWPGSREVAIQGDLDLAVSRELEAALQRAVEAGQDVLLDLAACDFIDVSAFEVLKRGTRELRAHGHELMLCGVHDQVERLLSLSGERGLAIGSRALKREGGDSSQGTALTNAA